MYGTVLPLWHTISTAVSNMQRSGVPKKGLQFDGGAERAVPAQQEVISAGSTSLMSGHRATAIANEFLRRRGTDTWPAQMLIQKLVYIAHGWALAITGKPLVAESPEAWDNGPVFRSIWDHIRDFGYRGEHCTLTEPDTKIEIRDSLTPEQTAIIDHVWRKYGGSSGIDLSKMTHEPGTP